MLFSCVVTDFAFCVCMCVCVGGGGGVCVIQVDILRRWKAQTEQKEQTQAAIVIQKYW